MPGPSVAWDSFELEDFLPGANFDAELLTQIRNNQEHLYEIAHAGGYGGGSAHTHASSGASSVDLVCHENLLVATCPREDSDRNAWTWSGFSSAEDYQDFPGIVTGGETGNHTLYQIVGSDTGSESIAVHGTATGGGMDCVASFFIQSAGEDPMSAGALSFGFADNSTSTFTASASLSYTDISNSWTRVYARFTAAAQGHSTDVRFLIRVTSAFTGGVQLTGFQINRGRHLSPWTISNVEGQTAKDANVNYRQMPNCPLLDWRISMSDAVDLTP